MSNEHQEFAKGDRVRIVGKPVGVTLGSPLGTIAGADPRWEGYWLVDLEEPATEWEGGGVLSQIVEMCCNLRREREG